MLLRVKQELYAHILQEKNSPFRPQNFIVGSDVYVDESRFKYELNALRDFNLGPIEEVRASRKYIIDETNGLKIFLNSCPHRGARLNQSNEGIVCSYHGWRFDQEGWLVKSTGHSCPFPRNSLKLQEIEVFNVGGMLMTGKKDLYAEEIQAQFPVSHFLEKRNYNVECNWKFLVESLLETYHFPFAHTPYLEGFENAFHSLGRAEGRNARIVVPLDHFEKFVNGQDLDGINVMYYFFPYSFVLFMTSGFVWFHIVPVSVNQSRMDCYLFSYDKEEEAAKSSLNFLEKILDQDFTILEGQQQNAMTRQRFHLTGYEKLIQLFHRNIDEILQ